MAVLVLAFTVVKTYKMVSGHKVDILVKGHLYFSV